MRKTLLILECLLVAGALGCQRPAARHEAAATTPVATLAALGTPRAPGLWEQRVSNGTAVQISRVCLDAAMERTVALAGRSLNEAQCGTHTVTQGSDGWHIATICDMGAAGRVTTRGLATGDFAHRYQIRFDQATTGAASDALNGNRRLIVDATWQGPCPAGMAPGQMDTADGHRLAITDMLPATAPPTGPAAATPGPAAATPATAAPAATQAPPALRR